MRSAGRRVPSSCLHDMDCFDPKTKTMEQIVRIVQTAFQKLTLQFTAGSCGQDSRTFIMMIMSLIYASYISSLPEFGRRLGLTTAEVACHICALNVVIIPLLLIVRSSPQMADSGR